MKDEEIHDLFMGVAQGPLEKPEEVKKVFSILVKATLSYRDDLLASRGVILTVEDVKTALNWLVPALATGELPETENRIRLDLVKTWLDRLRREGPPIHF
ncbi:MAG: hypothetical protein ACOWYE_09490 [Desulfatiglandales bacterium]